MKTPDCVTFSITAAVISIEVTISVNGIKLNNMQGGSLEPIESIIGVTLSLQKLIKVCIKFLNDKKILNLFFHSS